jgi:hypothetical protein
MQKLFSSSIILLVALSACQTLQPTQLPAQSSQQAQASNAAPSAQAPNVQSSGNLCDNPYMPAVEGATWTYDLITDSGIVTQTDTVTDVGTDAFLVETQQPDLTWVITWHCSPEGLYWLQSDGGMFSAIFQGDAGTATIETLSNSGVSLPTNVQPGDNWTATEEIHVAGYGVDETFSLSAEVHAVGMELVTVPAGTFDALRIDYVISNTSQTLPVTIESSSWFAEGVGQVKNSNVANGSINSGLELTAYSIP